MEPFELLDRVVSVIEKLGSPYLVTGSMATIFFGEPRLTNDIDIVLDLPPRHITAFCQAFPMPEFYVSEDAVRQAVQNRGQFNIIHPASVLKVDIMIPDNTPFNRSRFARALRVEHAPGLKAAFASPEDVILKKMEYYREGGSDKHLRDICGVLKVLGDRLDRPYIDGWVGPLGLESIWRAVRQRLTEKGTPS